MKINYIRYGLFLLGGTIVIPVLLAAIHALTGIDMNTSATAIIPTMMAALHEGQKQAITRDQMPTSGAMWREAVKLTGVGAVINVALGLVYFVVAPEDFAIFQGNWGILIAISVAITLFLCLMNRWFLGQGIRNQLKMAEKKAKSSSTEV